MRPIIVPVLTAFMLVFAACEKDKGTMVSSGITITFRTDSAHTGTSGPAAQGDTLRIGAIITEGAEPLERFYLSVSYDSAAAIGRDTVDVNVNPFNYEVAHITRTQPGTEQVIFTVEEPDGNRTIRRLTFIVP